MAMATPSTDWQKPAPATCSSSEPPTDCTLPVSKGSSGKQSSKKTTMDSLPSELLSLILLWDIKMCICEKNTITPLRLVCKAFDRILRPYVFKTVQLEFTRFLRQRRGEDETKAWEEEAYPELEEPACDLEVLKMLKRCGSRLRLNDMVASENSPVWKLQMDREALRRVGECCEALYLDLMVVRDDEELNALSHLVSASLIPKVPEMVDLLAPLRRYCMDENTFDETDFREVVENVLAVTPNLTRLKLCLPFQIVGPHSPIATLLLATTLAAITNRPEESKQLDTLVLDYVSDTTIINICNNPMDLSNAINVFSNLKHLVLSIKRQESRDGRRTSFTVYLWFLIRKAANLESLCLIGWNPKRDAATRTHVHGLMAQVWDMRSLPFYETDRPSLCHLRFLELKRVDIEASSLMNLLTEAAQTLKELYLIDVYLKIRKDPPSQGPGSGPTGPDLWIGDHRSSKPANRYWVAQDLREIEGLKLDVLRATGIGYDVFDQQRSAMYPYYDLRDPLTHLKRSFDQRFVEAALGPIRVEEPIVTMMKDNFKHHPTINILSAQSSSRPPLSNLELPVLTSYSPPGYKAQSTYAECTTTSVDTLLTPYESKRMRREDFDAETFQRFHNTTSKFRSSMDGYFFNHNNQALKELGNILTVANQGQVLVNAEIAMVNGRALLRDPAV